WRDSVLELAKGWPGNGPERQEERVYAVGFATISAADGPKEGSQRDKNGTAQDQVTTADFATVFPDVARFQRKAGVQRHI
ncbi:hypothetical protein DF186_22915, partial [Enterococcus hirae]